MLFKNGEKSEKKRSWQSSGAYWLCFSNCLNTFTLRNNGDFAPEVCHRLQLEIFEKKKRKLGNFHRKIPVFEEFYAKSSLNN